jgi:hypothetical protein
MAGILFAAIYSTSPELPITMPTGVAGHPVGRTAGIGGRRDAGRVGPEAGLSSDLLCWFEQDSPEGMATR